MMAEGQTDKLRSLNIVAEWVDAANRSDVTSVAQLSAANIELVGPKGSAKGTDALQAWIGRAGITLETLRCFSQGSHVVLEQQATWAPAAGDRAPSTSLIATHFTVESGVVARVARFPKLATALADAGLSPQDEKI
jgi:hypothetical protein